jgi:ribosomal-protein-serine acetyltransferase
MSFQLEVNPDICLRLMRPEQAPVVAKAIDTNRSFLRQWLPWVDDSRQASDTAQHLDFWWHAHGRGGGFSLGIFYRDEFAGIVGFHGFDLVNRITSMGYWLGQEFNGYGIMTRSVARLLDYAIFDRNMNRIFIRCATGNSGSRAIPERLGFVHEGCQREAEWLYDHFVDLELYSILAREWQRVRSTWPDQI